MKRGISPSGSSTSRRSLAQTCRLVLGWAIHSIMSGRTVGSESGLACLQLGAGMGRGGLGGWGAMLGRGQCLDPDGF